MWGPGTTGHPGGDGPVGGPIESKVAYLYVTVWPEDLCYDI